MQTSRLISIMGRYALRPMLLNFVRPCTTPIYQISRGNKHFNIRPKREHIDKEWFQNALTDLKKRKKENLSYAAQLAYIKKQSPVVELTDVISLRNLAKGTSLADVRKFFPNAKYIRSSRHPEMAFVKFASTADASEAVLTINNASSYPFATSAVPETQTSSLPPAFAEPHNGGHYLFDDEKRGRVLVFPRYAGTEEYLRTILEPFVPPGHELKT
ncbi:hypothetical protein FRC17_008569, partial [Serendipita sp. 399]